MTAPPAAGREPRTGLLRYLELPSEVLLIGLLVTIASLPVVTSLAAAGAGATLLREMTETERTPTVRRFVALLGTSLRQPIVLLTPLAVVAVAGTDLLALAAGVPGGRPIGLLTGLALIFVVIIGVRSSAKWRPGATWRATLARAAESVPGDWRGSLMLVGAVVVLGVVVFEVPAFAPILPGLLVLAAVAVEGRRTK
ncbi:hypothetical protein GTY65_41035 [Streptomyces sp. SID8379]|uniref:hypothetical protein n=1 Tax=unclassified Streptomyces TaxID=2593676 RepID=UPI0007C57533|nr:MULTISPECIES: hypothetical protein [unclassified Streptomyces]MYW70388.1 hypothetical protein [Streptomyces sp. SID8379]